MELLPRFASVLANPSILLEGLGPEAHRVRVFSGDALSPSLEASVLQGDHMTELLNLLKIDVACYGNHDFDFGEARLADISSRTCFPWTLANAVRRNPSPDQSTLLASAQEFVVRDVAGFRIGFFGLAGT